MIDDKITKYLPIFEKLSVFNLIQILHSNYLSRKYTNHKTQKSYNYGVIVMLYNIHECSYNA